MDPISILLAAYLDSIVNLAHGHFQDTMGTQLQSERIEHQGEVIDFQHQLWRVRESSVCGPLNNDLQAFSACTLKAKAMFVELCHSLSQQKDAHWRITKSRTMYCNAANMFQPTEASITAAEELDEFTQARQHCNIATAAALGSHDQKLINEREEACEAFEAMRASQAQN